MADVDISDFIPTIESILRESDPYEITARDVRRKLEQKFNIDLTPRKQEVQKLVDRCFDDLDMIGEDTEPKVAKKKKQNNNEEKKQNGNSEEKLKKKKKGRPPKTQVKVRESDYSSLEDESPQQKKKRGRKPKSSSVIAESSEAEYERKFEEELLNESNGKKSKSKSNSTTSKKKSNKRKKRDDDEQDGEERKKRKKGNTGIHKPLILSSVLAEFLQAEEMSRLEVVKRLWAYIKEHGLQDPNDKRFIVCDSRLMSIFKQDRIHSFTMNKFLTVHLKKKEAPTDIDTNGTAVAHYENRTSKNIGKDNKFVDDIPRDERVVEVKIEARGDWENLDDEDNEENVEENEENEENEDNDDDEDLFGEEDTEWVKHEENGDENGP